MANLSGPDRRAQKVHIAFILSLLKGRSQHWNRLCCRRRWTWGIRLSLRLLRCDLRRSRLHGASGSSESMPAHAMLHGLGVGARGDQHGGMSASQRVQRYSLKSCSLTRRPQHSPRKVVVVQPLPLRAGEQMAVGGGGVYTGLDAGLLTVRPVSVIMRWRRAASAKIPNITNHQASMGRVRPEPVAGNCERATPTSKPLRR